jgi:hypothetical protein
VQLKITQMEMISPWGRLANFGFTEDLKTVLNFGLRFPYVV